MTRRQWLWLALGLAALIFAVHGAILRAGLFSDDYVVLRPWTRAELAATLTGSWDPLNYNDPYHRPLTALYQAAVSTVIGPRPVLLHAWSLALVWSVALMLAWFVQRETSRPRAAVLAALVFVVHPMLPESSSAWIFRQMALVADLLALGALLSWQDVRDRPLRAWWPVACWAGAAFYLKEDGVMAVPAIVALEWLRGRRSLALAAAGATLIAGLGLLRWLIFPEAASFTAHIDGEHLHEFAASLYHVVFRLPGEPLAFAADTAALLALGLASWTLVVRRSANTGTHVMVTAGVLLLAFGAPLYFIGGAQRSHLITLASALLFAGALDAIWSAAPSARRRAAAAALAVALLLSFAAAARTANTLFAPCSAQTLDGDFYLAEWPGVTPALRDWLSAKRAACNTGQPLPALPTTFVEIETR